MAKQMPHAWTPTPHMPETRTEPKIANFTVLVTDGCTPGLCYRLLSNIVWTWVIFTRIHFLHKDTTLALSCYRWNSFISQMKQFYFNSIKLKHVNFICSFCLSTLLKSYRTHQAAPTTDREMDMPVPISPHIYGEVDIRNLTSQIKNYT